MPARWQLEAVQPVLPASVQARLLRREQGGFGGRCRGWGRHRSRRGRCWSRRLDGGRCWSCLSRGEGHQTQVRSSTRTAGVQIAAGINSFPGHLCRRAVLAEDERQLETRPANMAWLSQAGRLMVISRSGLHQRWFSGTSTLMLSFFE